MDVSASSVDTVPSPSACQEPVIDLTKVVAETIFDISSSDIASDDSDVVDDLSSITDVFDPAQCRHHDDIRPTCAYQSPTCLDRLPEFITSSDVVAMDITLDVIPKCEDISAMLSDTFFYSDDSSLCTDDKPIGAASHSDSFTCDSRFNDSLTSLLDSPATQDLSLSGLEHVISDSSSDFSNGLLNSLVTQPNVDIFKRETQLSDRIVKLEPHHPQDIKQLSDFYRYQASLVEMERYNVLSQGPYSVDHQCKLNLHFDSQLHDIMDRVEQSLCLLEESLRVPSKVKSSARSVKPRPLLSKKAVRIMEQWYDDNLEHPYPTPLAYDAIAVEGGISVEQVKKWFANKRNRSHNTRSLTEIAKKKRQIAMRQLSS